MRFEEPAPTHVIAHISDTHLLGGDRKLFGSLDVKANLENLLDRLREGDQKIDALVFTGDIADIGGDEGEAAAFGLDRGARTKVWIGNNLGASVVRVEPLLDAAELDAVAIGDGTTANDSGKRFSATTDAGLDGIATEFAAMAAWEIETPGCTASNLSIAIMKPCAGSGARRMSARALVLI